MKKAIILILLALSCFCLQAQDTATTDTQTSVTFIIKNFGINVDGFFTRSEIKPAFDDKGDLKSISAKIEVASISTEMEARDKHLLEEDYFHVKKFDGISLETTEIKKESTNNFLLTGNLIIKGVSKTIKIPIQVGKDQNFIRISSNFEINRRDFNVGGSSLVLGKRVKVTVNHIQPL